VKWRQALQGALSERAFNHLCYYYLHVRRGQIPKLLNLRCPKTFTEKTIWLKMHHRAKDATRLVDKVAVKEYVRAKIGSDYIVPTLAVYDFADQIDPDSLPKAFVMKTNHGSGWNVICRDKNTLDWEKAKKQLDLWMASDYSRIGKEYQYAAIPRKILCEPMLGASDQQLNDYKVFCFSGQPTFIQVDVDRFTNHQRCYYDVAWNRVPFTTLYPLADRVIPRPPPLREMLEVAAVLSSDLVFARIDFYVVENRLYFGEVTLHHGGGFEPFFPRIYDARLGAYIQLPSAA
jgi:hypothetical protein